MCSIRAHVTHAIQQVKQPVGASGAHLSILLLQMKGSWVVGFGVCVCVGGGHLYTRVDGCGCERSAGDRLTPHRDKSIECGVWCVVPRGILVFNLYTGFGCKRLVGCGVFVGGFGGLNGQIMVVVVVVVLS